MRPRTLPLFAVVALATSLAACGGDDSAAERGEILPFELVQDSEFTFELDPLDPSRAVFRVTTTEPMICSITWGPTPELGNLNNSLSMDGSGIIQHDVPLPGAEPGETYHFTVQGSTADGRVFQSEMDTFTLPEAEAGTATTRDHGENLALDATVADVSSEFSDAFAASNAIDGDTATEWATSGDGSEAFIELDLGEEREIGGVQFVTRSMADGSSVTTEFSVTIDGTTHGPFAAGTPAEPGFVPLDTSGRILRFEVVDSSGGNTGAVEIGVFAPVG